MVVMAARLVTKVAACEFSLSVFTLILGEERQKQDTSVSAQDLFYVTVCFLATNLI